MGHGRPIDSTQTTVDIVSLVALNLFTRYA